MKISKASSYLGMKKRKFIKLLNEEKVKFDKHYINIFFEAYLEEFDLIENAILNSLKR